MPLFRKLATLATAAEAARRYAKSNPEKAGRYLDQAAAFVDKQTKGRYSGQISGAAQKAKSVAGIRTTPAPGTPGTGVTGNGHAAGQADTFGSAPGYGQPRTGEPHPGAAKN